MKKLIPIIITALLMGCSSVPKVNYPKGKWKSINKVDEKPRIVAVQKSKYLSVQASDRTLKTALTRIAKDKKMKLYYKHRNDYSITNSAINVKGTFNNLLKKLSFIYNIKIYSKKGIIYVQERT